MRGRALWNVARGTKHVPSQRSDLKSKRTTGVDTFVVVHAIIRVVQTGTALRHNIKKGSYGTGKNLILDQTAGTIFASVPGLERSPS